MSNIINNMKYKTIGKDNIKLSLTFKQVYTLLDALHVPLVSRVFRLKRRKQREGIYRTRDIENSKLDLTL